MVPRIHSALWTVRTLEVACHRVLLSFLLCGNGVDFFADLFKGAAIFDPPTIKRFAVISTLVSALFIKKQATSKLAEGSGVNATVTHPVSLHHPSVRSQHDY